MAWDPNAPGTEGSLGMGFMCHIANVHRNLCVLKISAFARSNRLLLF